MERGGMLRNRYDRTDLFALVPRLGLRFEPPLEQLDRLLDDDEIVEAVRDAMARRSPRSRSRGRPATPVEVVLRMLVVMRLYSWSYEQAEYFVNDSLVRRQFCRVYLERVPDDTTLIRWAGTIGPEALEALNDRVVQLARSLKVTRGRKLRVDTTAVETDIHFPTDSGLVGDGVRVVSRLLRRAKAALGEAASGLKEAFRSRVRSVRRLSQQLHRIARRKGDQGKEALKAAYGRLVAIGKRAGAQGRRVLEVLRGHGDDPSARRPAERLEGVLPMLRRAVGQAERRVLKDDPVPSAEKLVSLFEPHTQVIPRFKAGKPAEFGRKLRLDEVEGGLITGYAVLPQGGGQDQPYLPEALANHRRQFGRAPRLLAADRGMASAEDERLAKEAGVKQVALPHVGKAPPGRRVEEKRRRFRDGYRFRAGIEGRIHALKRDYGSRRCRYRGERGFGRWVGWGILAHNLAKVAGAARG
jgi:transposase, IS5 family